MPLDQLSPPKQEEKQGIKTIFSLFFLKRCWRIAKNTAFGFLNDDCYSKASALTFYSLLSIIPVLAVLFGIAKGFGFEQTLEKEINVRFAEQREVMAKLIQLAYTWLLNAEGGVIAGVGTVVLLWTVFGLLSNVETALNAIWKTRYSRPYARKISDYLATMIISPIFFVALSSINLFIHSQVKKNQDNIFVEAISPFLLLILKFSPYFLSWALFTFIYLFMPYTKVYARSAIIAGVIAGTAFQAWQWGYIKFQVGASSYGMVYGSFAALPLFLIWLQISWLILLAGAELAFETENNLFIPAKKVTPISMKAAALLITFRCVDAFAKGLEPVTDRLLAHELGVSLNQLHHVIEILEKERILSIATFQSKMVGYQPARAIDVITLQEVCDAVDRGSSLVGAVKDSFELKEIDSYLANASQILKKSKKNVEIYKLTTLS